MSHSSPQKMSSIMSSTNKRRLVAKKMFHNTATPLILSLRSRNYIINDSLTAVVNTSVAVTAIVASQMTPPQLQSPVRWDEWCFVVSKDVDGYDELDCVTFWIPFLNKELEDACIIANR